MSIRTGRRFLGVLAANELFASVFDYGCGQAAWLKAAQEQGVTMLVGIEGAWIANVEIAVDKRVRRLFRS